MIKLLRIWLIFGALSMFSQTEAVFPVTYSFEQAYNLQQKNDKPIFVFVYTDWCKFCHAMKKKVFTAKRITKILNESFYFVLLNAEDKKEIVIQDKAFKYRANGYKTGVHELAEALATKNGKLTYPTTVFLSKANVVDEQIVGFIPVEKLNDLLESYLKRF